MAQGVRFDVSEFFHGHPGLDILRYAGVGIDMTFSHRGGLEDATKQKSPASYLLNATTKVGCPRSNTGWAIGAVWSVRRLCYAGVEYLNRRCGFSYRVNERSKSWR